MTEKRFTSDIHRIFDNDEEIACADTMDDAEEIVDLLNEQEKRIRELEAEVLDLRAEVGRLNSKKEIEKPHWLKYESSKGYTRQVNQDIRFKGDVDD